MSLLTGANVAENVEKETDRLGGFQLLDTDVHLLNIELAYLHTATSGARALVMQFKNDQGSLRATQYFTSGTAKGCKTFYERDGKQFNLPGFTIVNDIFRAVLNKGMEAAELEEKVVKLYSKDAGGEVPTKVQMVMNLLNQKVALGVYKQTVDKTALGGDNQYHPTGETRDENEINKVFTIDGLTVPEVDAGIVEPTFINDWKAKYAGTVLMKAKGAAQGGTSGAPAGESKAPKKMFK